MYSSSHVPPATSQVYSDKEYIISVVKCSYNTSKNVVRIDFLEI
jgi:hypothetical protein